MPKIEEIPHDLSDRILILFNTFRKAREGYQDFTPESGKCFQEMLNESYEDALLMEARLFCERNNPSIGARSGTIIHFPVRLSIVASDPNGGVK